MTANPEPGALDRSRSLAILVGVSEYPADPDLPSLPAAAKSLDAMEKMLTDPRCGWTSDRVAVFDNEASSDVLRGKIISVIEERTTDVKDALVFYYVGHGLLVDGGSQLGMALCETKRDPMRGDVTSLLLNDVRKVMSRSGYTTQIEILDCCFAGMATRTLSSRRDLAAMVRVATTDDASGRYTVAASRHNETALYSEDTGFTYLTGFLREVLKDGEGTGRWLTMADVYRGLQKHFNGIIDGYLSAPHPTQAVIGVADRFKFALNPAFVEGSVEKPAWIEPPIASPRWSRRAVLATAAGTTLAGVGAVAAWAYDEGRSSGSNGQVQGAGKTNTPAATSVPSPTGSGQTVSAPSTVSATTTTTPHAVTRFTQAVPVNGLTLGGPKALAVAISRSGRKLLAVSGDNGTVQLWDIEDFARPKRLGSSFSAPGPANGIYSLDFSPLLGRQILAAGNSGGQILLWDLAYPTAPRLLYQFSSGAGEGCSVAFSADGSTLASASNDTFVSLWVTGNPDNVYAWGPPLNGHNGAVTTAVFGPRQYLVASGGYDDTVRLWDISDASLPLPVAVLKETDGPVVSLAFSPDGNTLAAGKSSGIIRLYDVTTPTATKRYDPVPQPQQTDKVNGLAFSRDWLLACASADHSVQLYDLRDPAHPRPIQKNLASFHDQASSVAFSADGRGLAAGGIDSTVQLWQLS